MWNDSSRKHVLFQTWPLFQTVLALDLTGMGGLVDRPYTEFIEMSTGFPDINSSWRTALVHAGRSCTPVSTGFVGMKKMKNGRGTGGEGDRLIAKTEIMRKAQITKGRFTGWAPLARRRAGDHRRGCPASGSRYGGGPVESVSYPSRGHITVTLELLV